MINEQRKKILDYLAKDKGLIPCDAENWYFGEDRLPVSRKDGSCSTINKRLIDPLVLNLLVEKLPSGECSDLHPAIKKLWDTIEFMEEEGALGIKKIRSSSRRYGWLANLTSSWGVTRHQDGFSFRFDCHPKVFIDGSGDYINLTPAEQDKADQAIVFVTQHQLMRLLHSLCSRNNVPSYTEQELLAIIGKVINPVCHPNLSEDKSND